MPPLRAPRWRARHAAACVLLASMSLVVSVTPARAALLNIEPITVDDDLTTAVNTVGDVDVLANDSDLDGGLLTVVSDTDGAHGTVACSRGGRCVYSPELDFVGSDSFDYTADDGQGGQSVASVSVSVTEPITYELAVTKAGSGNGIVSSSPGGIDCGSDCSERFDEGTDVTLTADPNGTSTFAGWSGGGCSGTAPTCDVTMNDETSVTASFTKITYQLSVSRTGTGTGTVTSSPSGISCGGTCEATYDAETVVTLTASPSSTSTFAGWTGACSGTGSCQVTMNGARSVTARFETITHPLTVDKSGSGNGLVSSSPNGIDCGSDCSHTYDVGTTVTLTASPNPTSTFAGWTGACSGTGSCQVTMNGARSVTARFETITYRLSVGKDGAGSGSVTSSPPGITCGGTCEAIYDIDTVVTLTADPAPDSFFAGWSGGGCTGTGPCKVTMDAARSVTATFALIRYPLDVSKAGTGAGRVSSAPPGIDCGADCEDTYVIGTTVTLTAAPAANSRFTGWTGGGCAGAGTTCDVPMTAARSVTATFDTVFHALTVTKSGTGSGAVSSDPNGIACGAQCSATFEQASTVKLTAVPAASSSFAGWSGGCSGTGPSCTVTMSGARSVTATFRLEFRRLDVTVSGTGGGSVASTPAGITCGSDCTEEFVQASTVTLVARPDDTSSFSGWSGGGCSGVGPCDVDMSVARDVTASFKREFRTLVVDKAGRGGGSVTSSPAGITCGGDCSGRYVIGTIVTLKASPDSTSSFAGWSEAGCSGTGTCKVTLSKAKTITATFAISDDCSIVGTGGDDRIRGTSLNDTICGRGGDDVIWGLGGADSLIGGDGNDTLVGGRGNDAIDGRAGSDTVSYERVAPGAAKARTGVSVDLAQGSAHGKEIDRDRLVDIERVIGTDRADELVGSARADALVGEAGTDRVEGRGGGDHLLGNGADDVIIGGRGNDVLAGGDGADRLAGGKGRDVIRGGGGADRLSGEDNSDRLYGENGRDQLSGGNAPRKDNDDRCDGGRERDSADTCEVRVSVP